MELDRKLKLIAFWLVEGMVLLFPVTNVLSTLIDGQETGRFLASVLSFAICLELVGMC